MKWACFSSSQPCYSSLTTALFLFVPLESTALCKLAAQFQFNVTLVCCRAKDGDTNERGSSRFAVSLAYWVSGEG